MYILSLSKQNIDMAVAEAQAILGFNQATLNDRFLLIEDKFYDKDKLNKLAYTKYSYKLLFSEPFDSISNKVHEFNFDSEINKSYKTVYVGLKDEELGKKINNIIWNSLTTPKVDVVTPSQQLFFICVGENEKRIILCALRDWESNDKFEERLPHKREGLKPISLHPRLARCLVNLLGTERGTIVDPFCGTGGILLEGLLSGNKVKGYDISDGMLDISRKNIESFNIEKEKYELENRDFFENNLKINFLVSDLPYGKNTTNIADGFYLDFMLHLDKIIGKRAVIVVPDSVHIKQMFELHDFKNMKLIDTFTYYIHKSMTKLICVINCDRLEC